MRARLDLQGETVNRLNFSITAVLVASVSQEPVNFDAVLTPSTLQYSISKAGKTAGKPAGKTARATPLAQFGGQ